jgi:hypothetical protein
MIVLCFRVRHKEYMYRAKLLQKDKIIDSVQISSFSVRMLHDEIS